MATLVSILPLDVLDALSSRLNEMSSPTPGRFLRLPHPRTGVASLFLPYERASNAEGKKPIGILEVQSVSPTNSRSWFLGEGEVISDGTLLVMTPIDPAFLLIPILHSLNPVDGPSGKFRPLDDMFEDAAKKFDEISRALKDPSMVISESDIMEFSRLPCTTSALTRVCDVKQITSEIEVYRLSLTKVVEYLRVKVARIASTQVLEMSQTLIRGLAKDGLMEDGREHLLELGRVRAACDLVAHYAPPDIRKSLLESYEFQPLDFHLRRIHEEILASAPVTTKGKLKKNASKVVKEDADSKKRKTQAKASQGVEKLKKVNVDGMSKLSSFFKKPS